MYRLKAYKKDYAWNIHWYLTYNQKDAMKYIKKLLRHFKLRANIYFSCYNRGYAGRGYIKLPKKNISLGMIAHEIGHLLAYKKGYTGHTKKAYKYIYKIYKYSIRYIPIKDLFYINDTPQLSI